MLLPFGWRVPACVHEPTDALDQILRSELFLDQHGLHTGVQSLAVFRVEIERGYDYDRNVPPARLLLQGGDDRKAVHLGHHQIEQDHIRLCLLQEVQRLSSVSCLPHNPLGRLKPSEHPLALDGIIFNQQDPRRSCRRPKAADEPVQPLAIDRLGEITRCAECDAAAVLIHDRDHDNRDLGELRVLPQSG
jgi:hypothetical protein